MKAQLILYSFLILFSAFVISCKDTVNNTPYPNITSGEIYFSNINLNPVISYGVYSISSEGTNRTFVTSNGFLASPPYQNKMLLARWDSGYFINRIYSANLNGSVIVEIPISGYYPIYCQLSPNAEKVLFTCDAGNYLCIVNTDGTGLMQLSENIRGTEVSPSFSPDGSHIAFMETEPNFDSYITIIDVNGNNGVRIKDSIRYSSSSQIRWSPDGTKLAFDNQDKNGKRSVFIINRDGSDYANLTNSINNDVSPDWSPDGTKILYEQYNVMGVPDLAIINSDGTGKRNLTNTADVYEQTPLWSPDGRKVLYNSATESMHPSLKVLDIASGNITNIADSTGLGFWNFSK